MKHSHHFCVHRMSVTFIQALEHEYICTNALQGKLREGKKLKEINKFIIYNLDSMIRTTEHFFSSNFVD